MKIHVPQHAEYRLVERGIDIDNIKKVISSPSESQTTNEGRIKVKKQLEDGRILTIIYVERNNQFVIITGYYEN